MAIAQTGTGKTAAFAIPVVHNLLKSKYRKKDSIRCLVMVPTRELADQIAMVFHSLVVGTDLIVLTTFGGVGQQEQIEELEFGVDILIATPGRMFDLQHQGYVDLRSVEVLVLDEADKMLAQGFYRDIEAVNKVIPRKHQTLFFSATINEEIKDLAYSVVRNPIRIQLSPKDPVSKNVTHAFASIEMDDKRFFLERYINENPTKKMLIFVRTKVRAERVLEAMKRVGISTETLHANKTQEERMQSLESFKRNENILLIATDISARGIDIPGVDVVINYDLPDIAENYVHRIGRTGRGMMKGIAISFCAPEEKAMLAEIEKYIGKSIHEIEINRGEKEIVKLLTEEKKNDWQKLLQDAGKKSKKESW